MNALNLDTNSLKPSMGVIMGAVATLEQKMMDWESMDESFSADAQVLRMIMPPRDATTQRHMKAQQMAIRCRESQGVRLPCNQDSRGLRLASGTHPETPPTSCLLEIPDQQLDAKRMEG